MFRSVSRRRSSIQEEKRKRRENRNAENNKIEFRHNILYNIGRESNEGNPHCEKEGGLKKLDEKVAKN